MKMGRSLLKKVLSGSKTVLQKHPKIEESKYYGSLSQYSQPEILDLIDELIEAEYFHISDSDGSSFYPLLTITTKGTRLAKAKK
jgi:superfamily II DNA helicase RecQ